MKKFGRYRKLTALVLSAVMIFSLLPGVVIAEGTNAPLSMALVIDNSFAAYEYNTIGDNSWLDAYAGLMEQAPEGSEFAIVTPDGTASLTGLAAEQEALYNVPLFTSTEASAASLLTEAAQALSGSSGQKMVVLSTASCYNNSELQSQIGTLAAQGIDVRVVAFEKDAQRIAAVEAAYGNVVVCRDVRELPLLLGDWYAELAELPAAPVMQPNSAANSSGKIYNSSFRTNKHEYKFLPVEFPTGVQEADKLRIKNGIALSELLNIYYFLPSWATSDSGGYQITDGTTCQWIGKGNLYNAFQTLSDAQSLIDFWGNQAEQLLQSGDYILSYDKYSSEDMMKVIAENIKRRMPVLAFTDADAYLIYSYDESTGKLGLFGTDGNKTDGYLQNYDFTIVDTGKYFNLLRSGRYISDEQSGNANTKTVTISLPDGYTDDSVQSYKKTEYGYEAMAYTGFANGAVSYQAGQDAEFVVSVRTVFDGITPNCYNATRNYIIKIYPDVTDGQWFAGYVFDMSNKGYLIGSTGDDGVVRFLPDDFITIAEFLTVIYRAADIANIEPYTAQMANHALGERWIDSDQYRQVLYGINSQPVPEGEQIRPIRREEAADILWKAFRSDECRVPHQLYEYDLNTTEYRKEAWNAYTDKGNFSNSGYMDSFHQLFLNGVLAGNDAQTLDPGGNLTRAETCKIVSKALYSLSEIGTTLDPVWDESNIETLTLGEAKSGNLSDYGGKNYRFNADKAGYYMVSTSAEKYALYNAGGTRMEPVAEKDGKDVYMVTSAQEMRLYTAGASNASVTTLAEHAPSGYIAPVEVVFDHGIDENGYGADGKKHFYIYDDHPEHIRACDLLDPDAQYPKRLLMHSYNLEPGIYTVFAYHHVNADLFGTDIYFDSVFYNNEGVGGDVKINKLGFHTGGETSDWDAAWSSWYDYQAGASKVPPGYTNEQYIASDPLWLSDIVGRNNTINYYDEEGRYQSGLIHLLMEFEVTGGSVNFATVAYRDKAAAKSNFGAYGNGIESVFEDLDTVVKGKGGTAQTIVAEPMDYIIDDTIQAGSGNNLLPFSITNIINTNKVQNFFTTNYGPLNDNNRWTLPQSAVIPLEYEGVGVTRSGLAESGYQPSRTWYLDATHTKFVANETAIPTDFQPYDLSYATVDLQPYFGDQTSFGPNENLQDEWISAFGDIEPEWKQSALFQYLGGVQREDGSQHWGVVNCPASFEITHEFTVNVQNQSSEAKEFSYVIQGTKTYTAYEVYDENGTLQASGDRQYEEPLGNNNLSYEIFHYSMPPGQKTTFKIRFTMITGCNPAVNHAFFINPTEEQKNAPLMRGDNVNYN